MKTTKELIENSPNFIQELTEFEKLMAEKTYKER